MLISLWILLDSKGGVLYKQERIGKNGEPFKLYKFRSMRPDSDKEGLLTIGSDNRITNSGRFIRKYKLDELAQLFNVLSGTMSLVGPRPEVRKYVEFYDQYQLKVLSIKPGITDLASIEFLNENSLLAQSQAPEKMYIEEIMPEKIKLNMQFINKPTIKNYLLILFKTVYKILIK